ncbi:2360_t:CDS:2 [Entrophospora sp. SA101]|nr:2360_t:CDS:2 [Entrophospora sp. SA101]
MDYNFIQKLFQAVSSREGSHAPQRTSDESLNTVPGESNGANIRITYSGIIPYNDATETDAEKYQNLEVSERTVRRELSTSGKITMDTLKGPRLLRNNKIQTTLNFPILYIKKAKAKVIIDSNLSNDGINLAQTINKKCEFIEYNDNDDDSCVVECNNDIDLAQTINKKHKFIEYINDNVVAG